jgi:MFS family permease
MHSLPAASWSELLWGRNGLRSLALAGGVALHAINVYIATTILPSVVKDIGGLEYYAWNTTLFVVLSILGSALSPKTMDAFGPRRAFLVAIAVFALGTSVCAAAPSMGWMLLGRTGQGFGGGLLLGLSYSSTRIVFEERLWSRAMALISSMWGIATLSGPAIGGIFAQSGHWRLAFWVVLPIAALLAWLVVTQIAVKPPAGEGAPMKAPLGKVALLVVSVMVVSIASLSSEVVWNVAGIVVGVGLGIAMARNDRHSSVKLLPTGAYSLKTPLGSLYACVALLSLGITVEVFVPYFLQEIHGFTPLIAGYLTALMAGGWTVGSIVSSGRGPVIAQRLIRLGPLVSALSLAVLAVLMPMAALVQSRAGDWWLILPLIGVGLGIGFSWPHLLTRVFKTSPAGEENIASSATITVQLYALAMGAAIAGMLVNAAGFTDPGGVPGAQQAALALFAVFCLAPALAAILIGGVLRPVGATRQNAA